MSDERTTLERVGRIARVILLAAIVVVATLIVTAPKSDIGLGQQFMLRPAVAEGGVCASPGYLLLTMGSTATDRFYIVDTNKQVICVYSAQSDKLRLAAARKFDYDVNIPEASMEFTDKNGKRYMPEDGKGVNRDEAKDYADFIKQAMTAATRNKKP